MISYVFMSAILGAPIFSVSRVHIFLAGLKVVARARAATPSPLTEAAGPEPF